MQRGVGRVFLCIGVFLAVILTLTWVPITIAQETTGGIRAIVKDKSGSSIPKANVELSGPALITPRKLVADDSGFVYFDKVPPGDYALTVSASNFATYRVSGIMLDVGKLPTFDVTLEVGSLSTTVEVTASAVLVDVTTSNVSVAIPLEVVENIPKGRSFQTLIPFAPGARQEPLQSSRVDRGRANGFQIDGASDSENTYLVEGLDTTEINNGGIKQNVVFEFVQEVQVKTSGLAAEYGGAMGGVVNVIQKRGSNQFHGGLVTYLRSNALDADDQCSTTPQPVLSENVIAPTQQRQCGLRADPATSINPPGKPRFDQGYEYYLQKQDHYNVVEPGFDVGGPIFKDKLWFFTSYVPTIDRETRTVNFAGATPGLRSFTRSYTAQNMLNRLDYQPFSKLHLFGGWQYSYSRITGVLPSIPDSLIGQTNNVATSDPTQFRGDTGSVNPSTLFNFGGDWTPNSHTVITARYGYFYYDTSDRGKPTGVRDIYSSDLTVGSTTAVNGTTFLIPTSSSPGAQFAHGTNFSNIDDNLQTIFDVFSRRGFSTDASYFVSKWGTHNFKVGYGFNRQANNVVNGYNTAQIFLFWNQDYATKTSTGATNCKAIIATNQTTYGAPPSRGCTGNAGYFVIQDGIITAGQASSYNHSIYFQDGWTVGHGLTLNLGVRFDKEFVPPFSSYARGVSFNFTDKVAPRIGGAYDLFHNGKLKIFASYGKFFDIMKYSLARGSFGGEYWHDCAYAIDTVDYTTVQPVNVGGHSCAGSESTPSPGVSATNVRFIENQNWRASAGSATDPGVDPNIKPMSQHEFVLGGDWAMTPRMGLEVRYARKRLDQAIEDISVDDSTYYIGNPGPNTFANILHRTTALGPPQCPTCPNQPRAIRRYDGLETRLSYRKSNLFGQLSYTWSRLTGNYAGLTDTDITDGNGGRHSPNNHRDFDIPAMEYTTTGKVMDGPLGTDRPHDLAMVGYYTMKWWGMESTFGVTQTFASGTPKSTCVPVISSTSSCQYFGDRRGTFANIHRDTATGNLVVDNVIAGARMPMYSDTDLNFAQHFRVSKTNEAMKLGFELNVANLFNQASVLAVNPTPWRGTNTTVTALTSPGGTTKDWVTMLTGWDTIKAANAQGYNIASPLIYNNRYGLPFLFQTRRNLRMAIRFTF